MNIEETLKEYCRTQDSNLFLDKLYEYFKNTAAFIAKKYGVKNRDINEIISDLVADASVNLPLKYDFERGKAKNMLYILMKRSLLKRFEHDGRNKRNKKFLLYFEEMTTEEEEMCGISKILEITVNNLDELKEILLSHKPLFKELDGNVKQSIIRNTIIECIEHPERFDCQYNSYIKDIAKKSNSTVAQVHYTLDKMNKIMEEAAV